MTHYPTFAGRLYPSPERALALDRPAIDEVAPALGRASDCGNTGGGGSGGRTAKTARRL